MELGVEGARKLAIALLSDGSAEDSVEARSRSTGLMLEVLDSLHHNSAAPSPGTGAIGPPLSGFAAAPAAIAAATSSTAPVTAEQDTAVLIQRISQKLAGCLGDSREAVRTVTRQCLVAHASSSSERLSRVIRLVAEFGIRHQEWRVRLHNILAVQQLTASSCGAQVSELEIVGLLEVLAPRLSDGTELVAHATRQTLAHFESTLDETFLNGIRQASPAVQRALEEHGIAQQALLIDAASPVTFPSPADATQLAQAARAHDFHPHQVMQQLETATKWQDRSKVLEEFHQSLLCIPVTDSWPHMSEVLLILNHLLTDTNFKITLTTLYIIGDLVDRWSSGIMTVVGGVVPGLVEKLGDNKIVIRRTAMKIFHKIFSTVVKMSSPHHAAKLLQSLTGSLVHRSVHVRLELMGVLVMALIVFQQGDVHFDREQVIQSMCQMVLQEQNERVAQIAIEAIAVLHSVDARALKAQVSAMLTNHKPLFDKVMARLENSLLPSVTDEGMLEFPAFGLEKAAPPSPPTRLPNAAVAVGRLGRKMFCLEDSSPTGGSPMQCGANLGLRLPVAAASRAKEQRRPGTTLTSASSSLATTTTEASSQGTTWTKSASGSSRSDVPTDAASFGSGAAAYPSASSRGPARPKRHAMGSAPSSDDSGSVSASNRDRRLPIPPLRVNFRDQEEPEPELAPHDLLRGSSSAEAEESAPAAPSSPSSRALGSTNLLFQGSQCAFEESPNYHPNWNRPLTRQAQVRGERRAMVRVNSTLAVEDISESPLAAARLRRPQVEPVDPADTGRALVATPSGPISDKLRLLKRPMNSRARSQGSGQPSISREQLGRLPLRSLAMNDDVDVPLQLCLDEATSSSSRVRRLSEPGRGCLERVVTPACQSGARSPEVLFSFGATPGDVSPAQASRRPRDFMRNSPLLREGAILYLDYEELPTFEQLPSDGWLEDVFRRLENASDWVVQFEALTNLRRVARYAPQLLGSGAYSVRQAVNHIIPLVDSFRSSVARGALLCLHSLFLAYRKGMDAELERCAPVCLKKAVDANKFLSEEAERTLAAMCQSVSEARALATLIALAADGRQKSTRVRAKCFWCLSLLVQRLGARIARYSEVERLLQLLAKTVGDSSGEVRSMVRQTTVALHAVAGPGEEFDRLLGRSLNIADALKIRQCLDSAENLGRASAVSPLCGDGSSGPIAGAAPASAGCGAAFGSVLAAPTQSSGGDG